MTNAELIAAVAERSQVSQAQVKKVMAACADVKTEALARGEEVAVAGEGKFTVKHSAGRVGRNPRTGEEVNISARNVVRFKVAKALADAVNRR